jgi:hypothetical protein
MGSRSGRTPLAKRILFSSVLLIIVIGAIELTSFVGLRFLEPTPGWETLGAEREQRANAEIQEFLRDEALHPYLGWVLDRDAIGGALILDRRHPVNEHGFVDGGSLFKRHTQDELRIAVLGGSVAWYFASDAAPSFVRSLRESPIFRDKTILVLPLAISGYKQPQQLMTLTYLLSLGAEFDAVVNVDGFNEVALHPAENAREHVSIAFPRYWAMRVAEIPDSETAPLVYRMAALRLARKKWASAFERLGIRRSPTVTLVWRLGDARMAAAIERDRNAVLEHRTSDDEPFRVRGPRAYYRSRRQMFEALAELWTRSSVQLDGLCRANGIAYYHFLQPNQYLPDSKPMSPAERSLAIFPNHPYQNGVEQGYPLLIEAGNQLVKRGVRFHDLTMLYADTAEPVYRDSCCHFNERGNEMLAAAVARAMIESPPDLP